jgi:hypothetical protein
VNVVTWSATPISSSAPCNSESAALITGSMVA